MWAVLSGEFFWGVIVGVVLTGLGGFLQVRFQANENRKERLALIRSFIVDTARNVQRIVADMEETRRRVNAIHSDFLVLFDVEMNVFGRNREQIVSLPVDVRDRVRAYMNDCSLMRAQIGGGLGEFNRLVALADQLQAGGNGPQAERTRAQAS